MSKIEKVIFIKNAVETLGYFSEQLALEFEHCGIDTCFIDYDHLAESIAYIPKFAVKGKTAFVTFNFIGQSGEDVFLDRQGMTIWELYDMQCINILVDHPIYYHSRLVQAQKKMTIFCIDREHVRYIKRFYPGIRARFLPIAGNVRTDIPMDFLGDTQSSMGVKYRDYDRIFNYEKELIPYGERKYDLIFTANYVPLHKLYQKIEMLDQDYVIFYRGILDELIANPVKSVEEVMERHIVQELGEQTDRDKRAAMSGMMLVDLCVRAYFRGEIIKELAEAGIKINVFGADWNLLGCKKPWNIIRNGGQVNSGVCVQAVRDARIALNIMPWFKDGAHDRVFTAMLQKTVALTDDSKYLRKEFTDGENIVFFSLEGRKYLPDIIHMLLNDPASAAQIAEQGYQKAYEKHTWRERARKLMEEF